MYEVGVTLIGLIASFSREVTGGRKTRTLTGVHEKVATVGGGGDVWESRSKCCHLLSSLLYPPRYHHVQCLYACC